MGAGIVPYRNGDFRNGKVGVLQQPFGFVAAYRVQEFDDGKPIFFLESVSDIILIQEEQFRQGIQGDIVLIAGAQIQMYLTQRIRLCGRIEWQGDELCVAQEQQHKIVKLVHDGVLPKRALFGAFSFDHGKHFKQGVKIG